MNKVEHYCNATTVDLFPWPKGIPRVTDGVQEIWMELELSFPHIARLLGFGSGGFAHYRHHSVQRLPQGFESL
jgi:hypothetical protein